MVFVVAAILCSLAIAYGVSAQDVPADPQPPESPLPVDPTPKPLFSVADRAIQYISEREKIPPAELIVVSQETMHFPALDRVYESILVERKYPGAWRQFTLLIDPKTGVIEPDLRLVREAERQAHVAKYGSLDPLLYRRLLVAQDSGLFSVAIWVADNEHSRQPEELYAELIEEFPAAEQALRENGVPWAVVDKNLEVAVRRTYAAKLDVYYSVSQDCRCEGNVIDSVIVG